MVYFSKYTLIRLTVFTVNVKTKTLKVKYNSLDYIVQEMFLNILEEVNGDSKYMFTSRDGVKILFR